jgi:hypothetical protein
MQSCNSADAHMCTNQPVESISEPKRGIMPGRKALYLFKFPPKNRFLVTPRPTLAV